MNLLEVLNNHGGATIGVLGTLLGVFFGGRLADIGILKIVQSYIRSMQKMSY